MKLLAVKFSSSKLSRILIIICIAEIAKKLRYIIKKICVVVLQLKFSDDWPSFIRTEQKIIPVYIDTVNDCIFLH